MRLWANVGNHLDINLGISIILSTFKNYVTPHSPLDVIILWYPMVLHHFTMNAERRRQNKYKNDNIYQCN